MYAIVLTGGKQYKVEQDSIIKVEKLDANVGDNIELDVLMISDNGAVKVGSDIKKAVVKAEVLAQDKAKKINIFKYKAKKNIRKRQGHRQPFTAIKITSIEA
ncbi:MAG: 50S ribosomal protein L21 [Clostridia bacterium]|nr:50S ribosomal protein L21 [Clostridia bacterium]